MKSLNYIFLKLKTQDYFPTIIKKNKELKILSTICFDSKK